MKETDYIAATNKAKATTADLLIRDILPGNEYGITKEELRDLIVHMREFTEKIRCPIDDEPKEPWKPPPQPNCPECGKASPGHTPGCLVGKARGAFGI